MPRRRDTIVMLAALAAAAALAGLSGEPTCALAQSPSCRSLCLSEYNQCRLSTKGSPACDSQYQHCLQSCLAPR